MNKLFIIVFTVISFSSFGQISVSQCDIAIDFDNTHIIDLGSSKFQLKSVIHHPLGTGDDAASQIHINVTLPVNAVFSSERSFTINNEELENYSIDNNALLLEVSALERFDFLEIIIGFEYQCQGNNNDQLSMSTWPLKPNDINTCDNTWISYVPCNRHSATIEDRIQVPEFPIEYPIPVPEICKYVLDCPGCMSFALCIGDEIRIPAHPDLKIIELMLKDKVVQRFNYDKNDKAYYLRFKKNYSLSEAKELKVLAR